MATRRPASVRRSGCCRAASVTGNSNNAAIRRAGMGDLLQGGALTALRAPGGACFTTVLPVGWEKQAGGTGTGQPLRLSVPHCPPTPTPAPSPTDLPGPPITPPPRAPYPPP